MTTLDERTAGLRCAGDDRALAPLVAQLDMLSQETVSAHGDMKIRHALAAHARDLAQQRATRSTPMAQARRWQPRLRARFGVAAAASLALLLGAGTYFHAQGPTPVSAQTVLHRATQAGPGANQATHAVYRVTSSTGGSGTADTWIGYDSTGTASELALNLSMKQSGGSAADMQVGLRAVGPQLLKVYQPSGEPGQVPVPTGPGQFGTPGVQSSGSGKMAAPSGGAGRPLVRSAGPGTPGQALSGPDLPGQALKGIVVGTLLAQKLSAQPNAYTLQQETLNGVPVYALQLTGADSGGGGATYYFNAQTYVLEGADWSQDGTSWQARLDSFSTLPLASVPSGTFGDETTGPVGPQTGGPAATPPAGMERGSISGAQRG